jgi:hypothetical protein
VADYYATTVFDGFDFANLLVKTREGRPIKIDNNTISGAKFAANARVHASVLSLYDSMRLKEPKISGKNASWSEVDSKVKTSIADAKAKGKQVVLLTNTLASPSTDRLIAEFIAKNPNAKHVVYDAVSESAALDAFETVYGERALVDYDFSKASLIVSVGADFLEIGKVVVMMQRVCSRKNSKKWKNVSSLPIRSKHDFIWSCSGQTNSNVNCKSKTSSS